MNTAIFSPSGGNVGIAFAVPAVPAKEVVGQLKEYGTIDRGWLGVVIQKSPTTLPIQSACQRQRARWSPR